MSHEVQWTYNKSNQYNNNKLVTNRTRQQLLWVKESLMPQLVQYSKFMYNLHIKQLEQLNKPMTSMVVYGAPLQRTRSSQLKPVLSV